MHAPIGLVDPLREMLLKRGERREGAAGERIALDELDPRLHLAFGPRAIRGAGARLHVPVATEGQVAGVKRHRPGRSITPTDQRAGIVAEHRQHDAAEVQEGGGDALTPIVLALVEKRFDEGPAGITQHRDQQKDRDGGTRDGHTLFAKVDLHLGPRRRFHAHRRDGRGSLRLPDRRHRPLDRPKPDDPLIAEQPMHDHRILLGRAGVERLCVSDDVVGQPPRRSHLLSRHDRVTAIPSHRVSRDAQLTRNRFRTPPAPRQLANRGDDFAFDHRYLRCRRYQIPSLKLHSPLLWGVRINGARGSISLSLYNGQCSLE